MQSLIFTLFKSLGPVGISFVFSSINSVASQQSFFIEYKLIALVLATFPFFEDILSEELAVLPSIDFISSITKYLFLYNGSLFFKNSCKESKHIFSNSFGLIKAITLLTV